MFALTYNESCLPRLKPRPISAISCPALARNYEGGCLRPPALSLVRLGLGATIGWTDAHPSPTPGSDGGGGVDSGGAAGTTQRARRLRGWGDPRGADTQTRCGTLGEVWIRQPGPALG